MSRASFVRAWLPLASVSLVAFGRALTAEAPPPPLAADAALRQSAFRAVTSEESEMRHEAAKLFPTDPWSRDDDFHKREWDKARDYASLHRMPVGEVLSSIDEGLRSRWPHGNPAPLVVTTPPCRPRAIY